MPERDQEGQGKCGRSALEPHLPEECPHCGVPVRPRIAAAAACFLLAVRRRRILSASLLEG